MFYKKNRGFTLVEMLIVILIIGILVALALPQFSKTKEHAIGKEAIANLKLIAAAEKIYRMEASAYYPIPAASESTIANINEFLRLSLSSGDERNWDYAVDSSNTTSTATRTATGGSYKDCTYTIDYSSSAASDEPATTTCP